jgi:hypothetical protein
MAENIPNLDDGVTLEGSPDGEERREKLRAALAEELINCL